MSFDFFLAYTNARFYAPSSMSRGLLKRLFNPETRDQGAQLQIQKKWVRCLKYYCDYIANFGPYDSMETIRAVHYT